MPIKTGSGTIVQGVYNSLHTILLPERKDIMFEFTYTDKNLLEELVTARKAYKGAVYDFTYEGRFLIYHAYLQCYASYIAIDLKTNYASKIVDRKVGEEYKRNEYWKLIPLLYKSLRYTSNVTTNSEIKLKPFEAVEDVFRNILPSNGYEISEEQIALSKCMLRGLMENKFTACKSHLGSDAILSYIVAGYIAHRYRSTTFCKDRAVVIVTDKSMHTDILNIITNLSSILLSFGVTSDPFRTVIRKPKESYMCLKKYNDYFGKESLGKSVSVDILQRKPIDMDELDLPHSIKKKLCVGSTCRECKHKSRCGYRRFVTTVNDDDTVTFQIMTHAFYLRSMHIGMPESNHVLPFGGHAIIDGKEPLFAEAKWLFNEKLLEKDISKCINNAKKNKAKDQVRNDAEKVADSLFKALWDLNEKSDDDFITLDHSTVMKVNKLINLLEELEYDEKRTPVAGVRTKRITEKLKKLKNQREFIIMVEEHNNSLTVYLSPRNLDAELNKYLWSKDISHLLLEHGEKSEYNN